MKKYFEQRQREYSQRLDKKTMDYQRMYQFELNPIDGHRTWNVEADAFKHTFMGADLAFKYGDFASFALGVLHETLPKNNPQGEWNMDSWNNNKGREIAKEILKEYGDRAYEMSDKERSDLIAEKVMQRMRNGELITKPEDTRVYQGKAENIINEIKKRWDGIVTGQAAPVEPFTRQQIGQMSPEEFAQNESSIMEQLRNGEIVDDYATDNTNENSISYTREDIAGMTTEEFSKNEQSIMAQLKSQGIPSQKDLPSGKKSGYSKRKYESSKGSSNKGSKSSNSSAGKWVTINGNHVLIKE